VGRASRGISRGVNASDCFQEKLDDCLTTVPFCLDNLEHCNLINMKGIISFVALISLAVCDVSGHYIFQQFSLGATKYPVNQYIRKNSNYNSPVIDLASNDLRCNVGATGTGTDTLSVKAGDQFTFTTDTAVYHQGAISLCVSIPPLTRCWSEILMRFKVYVQSTRNSCLV